MAAKDGTMQGSGMGGLTAWAEQYLAEPKVRWQDKLSSLSRNAMAQAGDQDWTYSRPHSLSWSNVDGIVFPTMAEWPLKVRLITDESSSMGNAANLQVFSEGEAILKQCGATLELVRMTDGIQEVQQDVQDMGRELEKGRYNGGTNLVEGFADDEDLDLIVVGTDGYTPWPDQRPSCPVIVLLVGSHCSPDRCPSWATVIEVD